MKGAFLFFGFSFLGLFFTLLPAQDFMVQALPFRSGEKIPRKYTCQGVDLSPALSWEGVPEMTKGFVLIVDDPDAPSGVWVHWLLYNIPSSARGLPEGFSKEPLGKDGTAQGENGFGSLGYRGPCPPPGSPHRYRFHLYALKEDLKLQSGLKKEELLEKIRGHILGESETVGIYQRI